MVYDFHRNPWKDKISEVVYFSNEKLKSWFRDNPEDKYLFLIPELKDEKYLIFLTNLEVQISLFLDFNFCFKNQVSGNKKYQKGDDDFNPNLNLHGLKFALKNITIERSIFLWESLLGFGNFSKLKGKISTKKRKDDDYEREKEEKLSTLMHLISENYWLYSGLRDYVAQYPQWVK